MVITNSTGDTITVTPSADTQTGVVILTIREYRARLREPQPIGRVNERAA